MWLIDFIESSWPQDLVLNMFLYIKNKYVSTSNRLVNVNNGWFFFSWFRSFLSVNTKSFWKKEKKEKKTSTHYDESIYYAQKFDNSEAVNVT